MSSRMPLRSTDQVPNPFMAGFDKPADSYAFYSPKLLSDACVRSGSSGRLRPDWKNERKSVMEWRRGDRLTEPLVRDRGDLRPASWDEALDRVAAAFLRVVKNQGPQAFGMFSCSKTTNELNFTAQKFVRSVIGCNNIDSCNRT